MRTRLLIGNLCSARVMCAHSPLLPDRQQIQYVSRRLPPSGLRLRVAHNTADEDQSQRTSGPERVLMEIRGKVIEQIE